MNEQIFFKNTNYDELDKNRSVESKKAQFLVENAMEDISRATKKVLIDYVQGMYKQSIAKAIGYLGVESAEGKDLLKSFSRITREEIQSAAYGYNKTDSTVISEVEHILSTNGMEFGADYRIIKENLPFAGDSFSKTAIKKFRTETPIYQKRLDQVIFSFEDIVMLDDRGIQLVLRETEQETLAYALKGTSNGLQEKIFRNMSQRAVSMLKEDMEFITPVRNFDVEKARSTILKTVFALEEKGEIVVAYGDISDLVF